VLSFFTADENALFVANAAVPDAASLEREALTAARRAGAGNRHHYGAMAAAAS